MPFKPVQQISTILKQQYFEPTISWSLRVVLALNVPLIVIPLYKGFSYEVIWSAFGAYMLSLIDYRGLHYRKIIIQGMTAMLVAGAALLGMYAGNSIAWSVCTMFLVGMIAALIRNWSDYGASIAVSVGFFFLFGLAYPAPFEKSLEATLYLLTGCAWAIVITLASFPLQPSNPVRRSVARIWKANTDLLDAMVQKLVEDKAVPSSKITEKELAVRKAVDQSRDLFSPRQQQRRFKTQHYDLMLELRKTASLFSASLSSLHEELETLNTAAFKAQPDISFYKTLSAFAQASARVSIVMFTFRSGDMALAKIRVKRCEIAVELFDAAVRQFNHPGKETSALRHFANSLNLALDFLKQTIVQMEEKLNLKKSDYLENYKLSFHEFISGLKPEALGSFASDLFRVNGQQLNYALRVALGLALGVFLFKYFAIDHGYWIALTMMIVIQPYYGATLKKGIERMIGTVAGIISGGLIMLLPLSHQHIVGLLIIDSFFVAYFLRNNYKVGVFFVTIMMVLLMQIAQQESWQLIGWRVLSTLTGAVLALIAGYAFWPVWEKDRFPALMAQALDQNKHYLRQLIRYLRRDLPAGETWYKSRRLAEGANTQVFSSAQRMLEEPKYAQQEAELNLALVGANIRITREITSIALAVERRPTEVQAGILDFYAAVAQGFEQISEHITTGKFSKGFDFSVMKEQLNTEVFAGNDSTGFIKTELEKIVFELEAMETLLREGKGNP
jgi:uncharacterized membrane protein YccC